MVRMGSYALAASEGAVPAVTHVALAHEHLLQPQIERDRQAR